MITPRKIEELADRLEFAIKFVDETKTPQKTWMKDAKELLFSVRMDIINEQYGEGIMSEREANIEISCLEEKVEDLESKLAGEDY